jgi:alanine dehydrogenase
MPATDQAPVFISSEVAAKVFSWKEAIAAVQSAYRLPTPDAANPPRTVATAEKAWLRTLPAMPTGCRYFGAKLMGLALSAEQPAVEYVIVLFDRTTSRIAAFIDGAQVTAYRTAATSAAAVDKLAPSGAAKLAVLGSGLEASMHTRAIAAVRSLAEIKVFSPTPARREQFADLMGRELGVPARASVDAKEATEGATIVLAAARSYGEKPILNGDWLQGGTLVVSIGSTVPQQREVDVSVIARATTIVCDRMDEVISETGDMLAAAKAGIEFAAKCRSLHSLMVEGSGLCNAADILLYKSVGSGLQDIVVAAMILERALSAGLTVPLPINFERKQI